MSEVVAPRPIAVAPTHIRWIVTFFGAGWFPAASGTFASMVALPFAVAMLHIPMPYGRFALLGAALLALALGIWASHRYGEITGREDPSEIVIDEVAGQWLALVFAVPGNMWHFFFGFLLFRVFDIAKPWPANWAQDHLPGGWGVMMDDIVAGLYAAAVLYLGIYLSELPYVINLIRSTGYFG